MKPFRRILQATDFSRASAAAFSRALALARENRAKLFVANVIPFVGPVGVGGYVPARMYEDMEIAVRRSCEQRLERLLAQARKGGVRAEGLVLRGVAHAEILRAARAKKADLVVLGTHGRTGVTRFLLGSVASRVIAACRCPVLTVRGR
jgi:nucleotide-binding universal stress UspA family protein